MDDLNPYKNIPNICMKFKYLLLIREKRIAKVTVLIVPVQLLPLVPEQSS